MKIFINDLNGNEHEVNITNRAEEMAIHILSSKEIALFAYDSEGFLIDTYDTLED